MTRSEILAGPVAERQNFSDHAMTEAEARGILLNIEREVASVDRRKKQAAFFARNIAGRLSPEAVAIYRAYAGAED